MLIDHLFWTRLSSTIPDVRWRPKNCKHINRSAVRRRSEASEPCGAYRKRIEPRCREFRGSSNLNSTLGDTETAKNRHARAGPKSNQSARNNPAGPQTARYEPPCMPTEVITRIFGDLGPHRWCENGLRLTKMQAGSMPQIG